MKLIIRRFASIAAVFLLVSQLPISPAKGVAPDAPTNVTAVASSASAYLNGTVTVRWNSVSGATAYAVRLTRQGTTDTKSTTVNGENNTEAIINGLVGGATYLVQVRTVKVVDFSEWSSNSLTAIPRTAPKAPAKPSATAGNAAATVTWTRTADADNGGYEITSYVVKEVNSSKSVTVTGDQSSATVTDLTRGSSATFTVTAINAANSTGTTSEQSDAIQLANVPDVPSAPTLAANANSGELVVTWSAPAGNGGEAITGYSVSIYLSDLLLSTQTITSLATLSTTFAGLNTGSYTAKVLATNAIGSSVLSIASNSVSITVAPAGGGGGGGGGGSGGGGFDPTPQPTPTPTRSPSPTPTPSPSPTPSATPSTTASASPSASASPTATPSATPTASPSASPKSSPSPSPTPTPSPTSKPTPSPTPTKSNSSLVQPVPPISPNSKVVIPKVDSLNLSGLSKTTQKLPSGGLPRVINTKSLTSNPVEVFRNVAIGGINPARNMPTASFSPKKAVEVQIPSNIPSKIVLTKLGKAKEVVITMTSKSGKSVRIGSTKTSKSGNLVLPPLTILNPSTNITLTVQVANQRYKFVVRATS